MPRRDYTNEEPDGEICHCLDGNPCNTQTVLCRPHFWLSLRGFAGLPNPLPGSKWPRIIEQKLLQVDNTPVMIEVSLVVETVH
jgi:hypothetical protein